MLTVLTLGNWNHQFLLETDAAHYYKLMKGKSVSQLKKTNCWKRQKARGERGERKNGSLHYLKGEFIFYFAVYTWSIDLVLSNNLFVHLLNVVFDTNPLYVWHHPMSVLMPPHIRPEIGFDATLSQFWGHPYMFLRHPYMFLRTVWFKGGRGRILINKLVWYMEGRGGKVVIYLLKREEFYNEITSAPFIFLFFTLYIFTSCFFYSIYLLVVNKYY